MASSKNSSTDKAQAKRATTEAKKSAQASVRAAKRATVKTAAAEKPQARSVAETAVDFPVGAVLSVSDRLTDLVEPWTGRTSAEKRIRSYRTQVRKSLKRTERRGTTVRRRATTEARRTRTEVEQRVRRAIEEQSSRAQGLVEQVSDQLASLR